MWSNCQQHLEKISCCGVQWSSPRQNQLLLLQLSIVRNVSCCCWSCQYIEINQLLQKAAVNTWEKLAVADPTGHIVSCRVSTAVSLRVGTAVSCRVCTAVSCRVGTAVSCQVATAVLFPPCCRNSVAPVGWPHGEGEVAQSLIDWLIAPSPLRLLWLVSWSALSWFALPTWPDCSLLHVVSSAAISSTFQ